MANVKHRWTFDEDSYCCEMCIRYYVIEKSDMAIPILIEKLSARFPDIPENSLKMKVQNIKQLLNEEGLENTLCISPLANYSQQNRRAMRAALAKSF